MYAGQTIIRRVVARCPARTEPLAARVRLGRLLQGADLAPPGMPPQAVLVVRRVAARRDLSLSEFRLRPEWEREAREEVARNWRRAVRPARGRVPADAEAVWFEDVSEWLAALGLAVERRELERHWCWQASHGARAQTSASATLARAWAESPRFVPAAVVRLARWGEAARVLGLLQPAEATALVSALAAEFDLAHAARARALPFGTTRAATPLQAPADSQHRNASHSSTDDAGASGDELQTTNDARDRHARPDPAPPWGRWLPSADAACERLHAPAQRLLSFAAALFHSPSHARTRDFAAEVTNFVERAHAARPGHDKPAPPPRTQRAHTEHAARGRDEQTRERDESHAATGDATKQARDADARETHARDDGRRDEASAKPASSEPAPLGDARDGGLPDSRPLVNEHDEENADRQSSAAAAWRDTEGHETALGGVLFLLNFFIHLRLPECFDEDFQLSEHVTGWGLAETFARALLAELGDEAAAYERDPLWGVLARLDGRNEGEPPAPGLRVGDDYRAPAHWLKYFVPGEAAHLGFHVAGARLELRHAGGFLVAAETLAEESAPRVAARLVEHYRAQGVALEGLDEAVTRLDGGRGSEASLDEVVGRFGVAGLGRWSGWVLPFMRYVLARALAEEGEELTGARLARSLLLRRGRVYATATHVDLVMGLGEVTLPVRRAGLDASPGWVRDLVRVVAFHYE